MYVLKDNGEGRVKALLKAGNDFVETAIPITDAEKIMREGEIVESDKEGYAICVSRAWYFDGEEVRPKKKRGK